VTAGWKIQSLGDVADVIAGQSPDGSHYNASGKGMPFYQGKKEFGEKFLGEPTTWTTDVTRIAQKGDVLMSVRAPVGPVNFSNGEICIGRGLAAIRASAELDRNFLFYFLMSKRDEIQGTEGAVFASINKTQIEAIKIAVPPLVEQRRIVGILDEAFAAIAIAKANAEKNLRNARGVFESKLAATFDDTADGWVDAAIGDHIRFIDYRGKTPTKTASGLRLITAKNVKMGYLQREPVEFVSPSSYEAWMTRGIPKKGDVLFTTEAPLANVAQLDTDEKVVFAQRIIIMQPDAKRFDSAFLKYLLLSKPVQDRIRSKGTGATVQGIKASLLKAIRIRFPAAITRQQLIARQLDELGVDVEKLESLYELKIAALGDLKKSLLHQAFTGQLGGREEPLSELISA